MEGKYAPKTIKKTFLSVLVIEAKDVVSERVRSWLSPPNQMKAYSDGKGALDSCAFHRFDLILIDLSGKYSVKRGTVDACTLVSSIRTKGSSRTSPILGWNGAPKIHTLKDSDLNQAISCGVNEVILRPMSKPCFEHHMQSWGMTEVPPFEPLAFESPFFEAVQPNNTNAASGSTNGPMIMSIEGDAANKYLTSTLRNMGATVHMVMANQALGKAQAIKTAASQTFDIIFVDLGAGTMMMEIVKEIKEMHQLNAVTPCIAVSPTHRMKDVENYGLNDILKKPWNHVTLTATVNKWNPFYMQMPSSPMITTTLSSMLTPYTSHFQLPNSSLSVSNGFSGFVTSPNPLNSNNSNNYYYNATTNNNGITINDTTNNAINSATNIKGAINLLNATTNNAISTSYALNATTNNSKNNTTTTTNTGSSNSGATLPPHSIHVKLKAKKNYSQKFAVPTKAKSQTAASARAKSTMPIRNPVLKSAKAVANNPRKAKAESKPIGVRRHTAKEKMRRASIVNSCDCFRKLLPINSIEYCDKATVFRSAVEYIVHLRRQIDTQSLDTLDTAFQEQHQPQLEVQTQADLETAPVIPEEAIYRQREKEAMSGGHYMVSSNLMLPRQGSQPVPSQPLAQAMAHNQDLKSKKPPKPKRKPRNIGFIRPPPITFDSSMVPECSSPNGLQVMVSPTMVSPIGLSPRGPLVSPINSQNFISVSLAPQSMQHHQHQPMLGVPVPMVHSPNPMAHSPINPINNPRGMLHSPINPTNNSRGMPPPSSAPPRPITITAPR